MPKSKSSESTSPNVRVVLVEDDPVYRQFVRQVLKKVDGVDLIAECSTGAEGMAICRAEKPEAMLLDLILPDQQGVDVVRTLRPEFPDMIVLLMTAHPRDDLPATAQDLVKTIRSVLAGGLSYTSVAGLAKPPVEPVITLPGHSENIKPDVLTVREREIATLVAAAMSSKEVAAKLGLSTRTVEKHRANIYAKLGVRDVVGLTRWCLYHGMVS
jgi:DNA-binding NarL/FixJ family response regulator